MNECNARLPLALRMLVSSAVGGTALIVTDTFLSAVVAQCQVPPKRHQLGAVHSSWMHPARLAA